MRDLYRHLDLPGQERNVMAIRAAIDKCEDQDLAAAASYILLSPKRKAVYDRNWRVMYKITQLRAGLKLSHTDNWRQIDPAAFESPAANATSSELAELRKRLSEKPEGQGGRRLQV